MSGLGTDIVFRNLDVCRASASITRVAIIKGMLDLLPQAVGCLF